MSASTWAYRPQLDGLRTVAVYLVLLFHAGMVTFGGGFIGVDLFFVLSGFLVSNVILSELDREGTFKVGRFYARRVRRLLPAAVVVIVVTCAIQLLLVPEPSRLDWVDDARSALLYFANWQFIIDASDYFNDGDAASPFLHFWSLSIEEQFYVVFPILVWLVLVRLRGREVALTGLVATLLAGSVIAQVVVARSDINAAYYATHTRVYQLLAGVLLALLLRRLGRRGEDQGLDKLDHQERPVLWAAVTAAGLVGVVALATRWVHLSESNRGLAATIASVAVIGGATMAPRFLLTRALGSSVPRYLGQISYGTYLWHWPVLVVMTEVMPLRPIYTAIIGAAVATGLASVSFQVFETPIRRAKRLDPMPWPVIVSGLAVSALVAAVVVPQVLTSERRPALAQASAAGEGRVDLAGDLAWTREPVPDDLPIRELAADQGDLGADCAAGTPESCVVVDGPESAPLVVLVGDSHAGMLLGALEALAEDHGFRLSTNIRNKCSWIDGIYNKTERAGVIDPCKAQRREFYDEILPAMDADLVVVTQRARDGYPNADRDVVSFDRDEHPDETFHQMLLRKIEETAATVHEAGARLLIVHSVLSTNGWQISGFDPLDCISVARTLGECAVDPARPPRLDSLYDYVAVSMPDTYAVELRDAYCPDRVLCAPVVGGLVTWKDRTHLSTSYLLSIRQDIWTAIEETGAVDGLGIG